MENRKIIMTEEYPAYFRCTNSPIPELLLSWGKKTDRLARADAIWVDMLYHQAMLLAQITKNVNHPAVKESIAAAAKIVDENSSIWKIKGKIPSMWAVGTLLSWQKSTGREFPYSPATWDFITVSPEIQDIRIKNWIEAQMGKIIQRLKVSWDIGFRFHRLVF